MPLFSLLKPLAYRTLCMLRAGEWGFWHSPNQLTILCYHGIARRDWTGPASWLLMPEFEFERQVRYLRERFDIMSMSEAANRIRDRKPFERPAACITFDDGYKNNLTIAYPILERLGIPSTIYLTTGFIGTKEILWMPRLERAMVTSRHSHVNLRELGLGHCSLGPERSQSFVDLVSKLYRLPRARREKIIDTLIDRFEGERGGDMTPFELMNWDDVARLSQTGLVEFGAHTVTHQVVSPLPDAEMRQEIVDSIRAIDRLSSGISSTFAYPNGSEHDFDNRAKRLLAECGILASLSTIDGLNGADADPYALKRITVGSEIPYAEFRLRVHGVISAIKSLLGWKCPETTYVAARAPDPTPERATSSSNAR